MHFFRIFVYLTTVATTALVIPRWYRTAFHNSTPQKPTLDAPAQVATYSHSNSKQSLSNHHSRDLACARPPSLSDVDRLRFPEALPPSRPPDRLTLQPIIPLLPKVTITQTVTIQPVDTSKPQNPSGPGIERTDIDPDKFPQKPDGADKNEFKKNLIRL
ncbi:hypothetical protein H072_11487 [Dactylellina haptotyla CBS 200.50]|uniref:Uncharacterized protein n=1 Tax=Dactylellina haptotyla (strain CBS 200.50) TaxID=1284197 RepID=S7ZXW5_DACHA|nr:hypothetical protein H072_11487 [Dactylellina haptotyla CBS 200.50]